VSRLSRQCGILNISQPYRPPRPVTGITLLYLLYELLLVWLGWARPVAYGTLCGVTYMRPGRMRDYTVHVGCSCIRRCTCKHGNEYCCSANRLLHTAAQVSLLSFNFYLYLLWTSLDLTAPGTHTTFYMTNVFSSQNLIAAVIQFWSASGCKKARAPPTPRIADVIRDSINRPVASWWKQREAYIHIYIYIQYIKWRRTTCINWNKGKGNLQKSKFELQRPEMILRTIWKWFQFQALQYEFSCNMAASSTVVVGALCYKPEGRGCSEFSSVHLILTASLGPGVYSVSNRNEYQKQNKKFLGSKERPVTKADNLTAICEPIV
jgi:hypothetical protein